MSADDCGIEHLNQTGRGGQRGQMFEEEIEGAALAQSVEPFPDAIPFAEALRQGTPGDIVNREIMKGLQKKSVIPAFVAPAGQ
tara:strand:+ start:477 stop:725 length:249 start_codon:yes stop_codon:yes gene_type:complete